MRRLTILVFIVLSQHISAQERPDHSNLVRWTKEYMDNAVRFDHFSGSLLIAYKGRIIFQHGYGLANREKVIQNKESTRFKIGSVSKQFTAAAIMKLAEQGKLQLDHSITRYISSAPLHWQPITIRHLLQHRSGLVSFTALDMVNANYLAQAHSQEDILDLVRGLPLSTPPGETFAYNNTGYFLLGMVVESCSGLPLDRFIKKYFLETLHMTSTGFLTPEMVNGGMAKGYMVNDSGYIHETIPTHPSNLFGIGGMYATTSDLLAWEQSFHTHIALSDSSVGLMLKPGLGNYGFSWITDMLGTVVRRYHDGGVDGFSTSLHVLPAQQLTIIGISNMGDDGAIRVCYDIAGHIGGNPCTLRAIQNDLLTLPAEQSLALIRKYQQGFPAFDIGLKKLEELAKWARLNKQPKQAAEIEKLMTMVQQLQD